MVAIMNWLKIILQAGAEVAGELSTFNQKKMALLTK
jgi:hypothetical protein